MSVFHNRTRRSPSIPGDLLRRGQFHLLPVYYVLRTSDLAREGIDHSGSYRFADHIYAGKASGRYVIGTWIDACLLRLRSARAMRARYVAATRELLRFIDLRDRAATPLRVLSVPCGLARELFDVADVLAGRPAGQPIVEFEGVDLDEQLVQRLSASDRTFFTFRVGDALQAAAFDSTYDVIVSTGLTEFLTDDQTVAFYRLVHTHMRPKGRFVTSGMGRHAVSDYLLRHVGELHTHYRCPAELHRLAVAAGFDTVHLYHPGNDLQTMLIGDKA
jgi:2-polyprenyl-3-methyl-5-hydroxy-6-metoxy-1,4-benzoquinol methylase